MNDFEKQILADLATLKSQMKTLLGNGQPGRLRQLEQRVEKTETFVQRLAGAGALFALLLSLIHAGFELLRWKR